MLLFIHWLLATSHLSFIPSLEGSVMIGLILQPFFIFFSVNALLPLFPVCFFPRFFSSLWHFRVALQWDPIAVWCVLNVGVLGSTLRRFIHVCYLGGKGNMANSVGGMLQTHPPSLPCAGVRALGCASLWMGAVLEELVPCNRGACCRQNFCCCFRRSPQAKIQTPAFKRWQWT